MLRREGSDGRLVPAQAGCGGPAAAGRGRHGAAGAVPVRRGAGDPGPAGSSCWIMT